MSLKMSSEIKEVQAPVSYRASTETFPGREQGVVGRGRGDGEDNAPIVET